MKVSRLLPLTFDDLSHLRDLYAYKKEHIFTHNTLQNYCNLLEKNVNLSDVRIFALNGLWREDGLFVIQFNNYFHFSTLNGHERLSEALNLLNLKSRKELLIFNGYAERFQDVVNAFVQKNAIFTEEKRNGSYFYYVLPLQRLKNIEKSSLPAGFYLAALGREHAEFINENWSAKSVNSLKLIKIYIEQGTSLGIYTDQGELVAWVMIQLIGAIGLLYVAEPYREHGFGSLLVTELSLIMHRLGLRVAATISPTNIASQKLFTKLGFEKLTCSRYNWQYLRATQEGCSSA